MHCPRPKHTVLPSTKPLLSLAPAYFNAGASFRIFARSTRRAFDLVLSNPLFFLSFPDSAAPPVALVCPSSSATSFCPDTATHRIVSSPDSASPALVLSVFQARPSTTQPRFVLWPCLRLSFSRFPRSFPASFPVALARLDLPSCRAPPPPPSPWHHHLPTWRPTRRTTLALPGWMRQSLSGALALMSGCPKTST